MGTSTNQIKDLQTYIAGDRNMFVFLQDDPGKLVKKSKVANFLVKLEKLGYAFSNSDLLFSYSNRDFKLFKSEFIQWVESNTKSGLIFRKTFGKSEELTNYTPEEWHAIFAQYSIIYGWTDKYNNIFGQTAENVLNDYVKSFKKSPVNISNVEVKVMSIGRESELLSLLKNIVESPVVLRNQQIKTLESTPALILASVCKDANITIKETLVKVMSLLAGIHLEFPLLKTATDVLRYIVAVYAHKPLEGQILKKDLKNVRVKIPSSARKLLLNNLEQIAVNRKDDGSKYLTEDMFTYTMFWKRLDKYLRYESAKKTKLKYPSYTKAIDLLYEEDKSWTFNSRFSVAKSNMDYDTAIRIAADRPGFLMRNLLEFLRMTKGTKFPKKLNQNRTTFSVNTDASAALQPKEKSDAILTDATEFLSSKEFVNILGNRLNTKLAWQLLENLKDDSIYQSQSSRVVQGITIRYSTPYPGVNDELAKIVKKQLLKIIKAKQKSKNEVIGNVFLDKDSEKFRLQYSGRNSTELSFAGEFLSPGTELSISDIIKAKGINSPLLRLGVLWRGTKSNQSVDIDHNSTFSYHSIRNDDLYYGNPILHGYDRNDIIGASSGDITSCAGPDGKFSTELIDVDLDIASENGVDHFYNSLIVYSDRSPISDYETYLFFSILDKSNRKMATDLDVDLSKVDYAIRIDPNAIDNTGSYIGVDFNLKDDRLLVLCSPIKDNGLYSNVKTNKAMFNKAIENFDKHLSIGYALKKSIAKNQFVSDIKDAQIVISRKSREDLKLDKNIQLIHPGRQMEEINKIIL